MKIDLQPVALTTGQRVTMRLPELVEGITGDVCVIVAEDALPDAWAIVKMTLDIEVRPQISESEPQDD